MASESPQQPTARAALTKSLSHGFFSSPQAAAAAAAAAANAAPVETPPALRAKRFAIAKQAIIANSISENEQSATLLHPLIVEAKLTITKKMWADWKGSLATTCIIVVLIGSMSDSTLSYIMEQRASVLKIVIPAVSAFLMWRCNYVEHVLQPPVKPHAIVSYTGKSVFLTVQTIAILAIYFTLSSLVELVRFAGYEHEYL
jgi:hypothetical protein